MALIIEVLKGGRVEQMKPCNSMDQKHNCQLRVKHLDEPGGTLATNTSILFCYLKFLLTTTMENSKYIHCEPQVIDDNHRQT